MKGESTDGQPTGEKGCAACPALGMRGNRQRKGRVCCPHLTGPRSHPAFPWEQVFRSLKCLFNYSFFFFSSFSFFLFSFPSLSPRREELSSATLWGAVRAPLYTHLFIWDYFCAVAVPGDAEQPWLPGLQHTELAPRGTAHAAPPASCSCKHGAINH